MADAETIALLNHITDIGLRTEKKLDEHIKRDEHFNEQYLLPLWNANQQQLGANLLKKTFTGTILALIAAFAGWLGGVHSGHP